MKLTFLNNGVVHVLRIGTGNSKIGGLVLTTYHFSIEQVMKQDMKQDAKNCLGCPFSYAANGGKSGGCYTHKGHYSSALPAMLKSLKRDSIRAYNETDVRAFVSVAKIAGINLIRFGAYGEPTTLGREVVDLILESGVRHTGYTHQWRFAPDFNDVFMASTHNEKEVEQANKLGWKAYNVGKIAGVNCPASKEAGRRKKCIVCALCNGKTTNVWINKH